MTFWELYGEAAKTSVGFFWKAGWAFILGYMVSAMIQAFLPKKRLTHFMGEFGLKSIFLATIFGAASSSCSFAALATARSLFMKGAHFVAAVAFMFASTNLVIELGILILIFLGWQYLAAEIIGGLLLIIISSLLIKLTYPDKWIQKAHKRIEKQAEEEEEDFSWQQRIKSREGWYLVGHKFVSDWQMVWEEILIGFTIAGFVAVFVPADVWEAIFLKEYFGTLPTWFIMLENAVVAPFVAGATFIGSMGNIPLATVLDANGVMFAGIMGFIYSDLMVPPLVMINAKYYGWQISLYIALVMFASIVITALMLHYIFAFMDIVPQSGKMISKVAQFSFDYTFFMNIFFAILAGALVFLNRQHLLLKKNMDNNMDMNGAFTPKRYVALMALTILLGGLGSFFLTNGK